MKRDNYVSISGWMVVDLGLGGDKLMVYAIVYGMTQDGSGWYCGGRTYIADWLGCSEKKAGRILSELVDDGLIIRETASGKAGINYRYSAAETGQTVPINRDKPSLSSGQTFPINRDKNGHITTKGELKETTNGESRRFAPPARDEVEAYAREKGYNGFPVDRFIAYYESNGWMVGRTKMKSWKAAMSNWWLREDKGKPKAEQPKVSQAVLDRIYASHEQTRKEWGL